MNSFVRIGGVAVLCAAAGTASAEIIISEIMYNPASKEDPPAKTEWVELYNTGEEAVDVSGWYLADEDGQTAPLPTGTTLEPKSAIVLIPAECTVEAFRAAWGEAVPAFPVADWNSGKGLSGLGNKPSADNEQLSLRDTGGTVIDAVHYQAEKPWPSTKGGSIYLQAAALNATMNDDGANWRRSEAEKGGAKHATETDTFSAKDAGSPGTVAAE